MIFDEFRDFRGFLRFLEQYIIVTTAWCATAAGITDDHGWKKMLVVKDSIKNKNIFRVEKNLKICFEKNPKIQIVTSKITKFHQIGACDSYREAGTLEISVSGKS